MLHAEGVAKVYDPPTGLLKLVVRTAHTEPIRALDDVSFDVQPGEVVGMVGPNGAGKSTLIRICTTLLTPTAGTIRIDDQDITERPHVARRNLGLHLADERALYWRLTGRENLRFFGVMAGLAAAEADRRADELLEQFDLAQRDRRVFGYSSGMRVRLGLARALMARPALLILDEPTRSLDPVASEAFLDHLRALAAEGVAVLFASHRLDEVEAMCDRVLVLVNGTQRMWAPTSALTHHGGRHEAVTLRSLLDADDGRRSES